MRIRLITVGLAVALAALAVAMTAAPTRVAAQDSADDLLRKIEEMQREQEERERQLHAEERKRRTADGTRGAWAISADASIVAAGTPSGSIEVWRPGAARPEFVLAGHTDLVRDLAFVPGEATLYSVGAEGTAKMWDLGKRTLIDTLGDESAADPAKQKSEERRRKPPTRFRDVTVSPDAHYVVLGAGVLIIWDAKTKTLLEHTPGAMAMSARFAADSRHLLVTTHEGVEMYDLEAPAADTVVGWSDLTEPVWRLRGKSVGFGSIAPRDPAQKLELGDADMTTAIVLDTPGLVVTLSRKFSLGAKSAPRPVLRAWDVKTGKRRWERTLADSEAWLVDARGAALIPLRSASGIDFLSPKDGTRVRSVALPDKEGRPAVLAPDASVGYTADRDGNLVTIPLTPPAAEPPAGDAPPAAPPAPK